MEIVRNLARRKLRTTLTVLGIVIGIFALTTMGAMAEHFNALLDGGVRYFGSNVQVGAPDGQAPILPLSKVEELRRVDGVEAVFPSYSFPAKPGDFGAVSFGIPDTIGGSDPDENNYAAVKTTLAQGRDLTASSRGEVVLGSTIANEFKKQVGDTIDLPVRPKDARPDFVSHTFTVVGILDATRTAPDTFAFVSVRDAQMLYEDTLPAPLKGTLDTTRVAQAFTVYSNAFKSGGAIFTAITTAAAVLALVIGGLSVVNTMIMAVTERFREIGLKKAVGAHTGHVLREYLAEAVLIGFVGGALGYGAGVLLTNLLNLAGRGSNLELFLVTPALTAIALGFAVALGALAGVIPALRAAHLDPVTALRTTN